MSTLSNWCRLLLSREASVFRRNQLFNCISSSHVRTFADTPDANSKQVTVQGTESVERVRVRRARPADGPRVLRFVREHARAAWPGLAAPPSQPQVMLCDYVARALAQGHSMLAEQQETRRSCNQIRGLALGVAVCPWDACVLDKWAQCVRCARSRRLIAFTAHCLRAPALHSKYRVHNILQVILIIPQDDNPKTSEIVSILAKNVIKRGQETGFPVIRFDATCDKVAKTLEELELKKEWQLSYDILSEPMKDTESSKNMNSFITNTAKDKPDSKATEYKHHITAYTIQTNKINVIKTNADKTIK